MKRIYFSVIIVLFTVFVNAQSKKTVDDAKGLMLGDAAPMFKALEADSSSFSLEESLKGGPVVVMFYRGHWCPVCTRHLSAVQDSLHLITQLGVSVVAVSPEKPELIQKTKDETNAEFHLVFDEDYKISEAYDVNFNPKNSEKMKYNTFLGAKLKDAHSDNSERLPIPATFIIDQTGKIVWKQFDPNYKNRASINNIVEVLMKKEP